MPDRWDEFAAKEPYFAVLTHPRFLRQHFDAVAEAEFFRTGEEYVSDLYGRVLENVASHFAPLSVLEYGCGVGRLLLPLARRAERVTGVDISPSMLDTARMHVTRAGLRNVELMSATDFAADDRRFDLVNCHLVLQRMRRREGMGLLRQLACRVREGGVGVFHLPLRANVSRLVRAARTARARVPGVNAFTNVLRGKPMTTPLIESNTYDINDVLSVLQEFGFDEPQLVFTRHGDLEGVVIRALRRHHPGANAAEPEAVKAAIAATPSTASTGEVEPFIDVKRMIAGTSIEDLNAIAERYFSSLENWEHHLAKPFARVEDTPQLLISLGAVLQGLALTPGMTILEFGAGTGWLSRFLTQLGCRMILLDVAPTALAIARDLYAKQPLIGKRPEPQFLVFDGRHINLPDGSVDRILCFDSFHHAPNPDDVLREFGRVLKPRGIAGFSEPGPNHSRTAQSQYEMRTYGVVENDIDIHAIWKAASRLGFVDLQLAAFNVPAFHVSLREYDDLLASGETFGRWAEWTRGYLQSARTFFLTKAGSEEMDSRRAEGLRCEIEAIVSDDLLARVSVRNTGRARWIESTEPFGGVCVGVHRYDSGGALVDLEYARHVLPRSLAPGDETMIEFRLPRLPPGQHLLEFDCVADQVAWFGQIGSNVTRVRVEC